MVHPTLEEARALAAGYSLVPVSRELYADRRTPIEVLRALRAVSRHVFLLESMESRGSAGVTPSWGTTRSWYSPVKMGRCASARARG
jgi:hypothetical protein